MFKISAHVDDQNIEWRLYTWKFGTQFAHTSRWSWFSLQTLLWMNGESVLALASTVFKLEWDLFEGIIWKYFIHQPVGILSPKIGF